MRPTRSNDEAYPEQRSSYSEQRSVGVFSSHVVKLCNLLISSHLMRIHTRSNEVFIHIKALHRSCGSPIQDKLLRNNNLRRIPTRSNELLFGTEKARKTGPSPHTSPTHFNDLRTSSLLDELG